MVVVKDQYIVIVIVIVITKMTPAYQKDSGSTENELIHMGEDQNVFCILYSDSYMCARARAPVRTDIHVFYIETTHQARHHAGSRPHTSCMHDSKVHALLH